MLPGPKYRIPPGGACWRSEAARCRCGRPCAAQLGHPEAASLRSCEVAKSRSMDLRDTRHPDHLIGAACKQPRGQLGVVWASYTYIQGCRTLCGGTSGLQPPSIERSEAANAAAHAVEHTWATEGAGKRAPSSSRSARIVRKIGRSEADAISGGRVDFTCAQKN